MNVTHLPRFDEELKEKVESTPKMDLITFPNVMLTSELNELTLQFYESIIRLNIPILLLRVAMPDNSIGILVNLAALNTKQTFDYFEMVKRNPVAKSVRNI